MAYNARNLRRLASLVVLAALVPAGAAFAADAPAPKASPASAADIGNNGAVPYGTERGVTKPILEPKLAFNIPGVVAKMNVTEGAVVKKGDVIGVLDTREEEAKLTELQGELKSAQYQIEAADADLEVKSLTLKRKLAFHEDAIKINPSYSNAEIDEARAAVKVAVIAKDYRNHELGQKKLEMLSWGVKKDLKQLVSPLDGVVAAVEVHQGEAADLNKPAVQVVQYDKLYVEVDVPVAKARKLKKDDTLKVCYTDDYNEKGDKVDWYDAKVIFLTPYADASSGTRKVRLEMKNTTEGSPAPIREAGLTVYVRVSDSAAAASNR